MRIHTVGIGKGCLVFWGGVCGMRAVLLTLFILAALFVLLSGFLIVCIAWTHRPISVWAMIKEFIAELWK